MIPVTILHEAEAELREAVAFYESRSSGLGLDFAKEIKDSVHLLQQFPDRWPLREDNTRRYLVHRFPYFVVYLFRKNHLWIIAFAHCRQSPVYWSSRIGTTEP